MIEHDLVIDQRVPLPVGVTEPGIRSLIDHVLHTEGVDTSWSVGILFMDDAAMQAAHLEFMDIDEPTDIMTFPYADEDDDWGDSEPGGDLMISIDRARENAQEAGWSHADEVHFLIAHGLLHLLGWDDHSDDERSAMLAHQRALMDSWVNHP